VNYANFFIGIGIACQVLSLENAAILARRIRRVVRDFSSTRSRFDARITRTLKHLPVLGRVNCLQDITKSVTNVCDSLSLLDRLVDDDQLLYKPTICRGTVMKCRRDVRLTQIRLIDLGRVRRNNLQIVQHSVHEGVYSVDERAVPNFGESHLDGDGRDLVNDEGGLDRARFSYVDLEGVGLEELCEALDIRKSEICITP